MPKNMSNDGDYTTKIYYILHLRPWDTFIFTELRPALQIPR